MTAVEGDLSHFVGPLDRNGRPTVCQNAPACSAPLTVKRRGRRPQYCNDQCRNAAWMRRDRARKAELESPTKSDVGFR